ncbi:Kanamycin B dioxygenase [Hyphodiscus hymeniophilus]|uniref:Kanamycin B dioxygenase n=1 Tax=Hyphodiscus hymeniophilus TaxID=353542 RepID=A0A9P6VQT7_9HELO|nr:Kanamycin B dioxygenase [Hyphodiscus hymeniophilus]
MISGPITSVTRTALLQARTHQLAGIAMTRAFSTNSHVVKVSSSERSSGFLNDKNLEIANRALHADGLVVLEDVIEHQKLDLLNEKMVTDALYLQGLGDKGPYNYNKGNIQQDPPLTSTYFDSSIFLNPIATQVTSSVLGPKPRLSFISSNSALPPSPLYPPSRQPVHSDADFSHPSSPFALVVNIPLITMTPENGSTEIWLGTHCFGKECQEGEHGERASGRIREGFLEQRRKTRAPCQPVVQKGSVVVRDLRLWHAGMPNWGNDVRVMLAMIHFSGWFRNPMDVNFSEHVKEELGKCSEDLRIQGKFVSEEKLLGSYLEGKYGNAYYFDQREKLDVEF